MINEFDFIKKNFCGKVIDISENPQQISDISQNPIVDIYKNPLIYICGDMHKISTFIKKSVLNFDKIYIIKELSYNLGKNSEISTYDNCDYTFININSVPINVNNVGVYFKDFFTNKDYFNH